jgi:hypothetical protein
MNIKLDNNDLTKLLGIPSINKQLDERLMDDFYIRDKPRVYENYYNNDNNNDNNDRQLVDIMKSLKFRKATGLKTNNNRNNKNTKKRYNGNKRYNVNKRYKK